MHPTRRLATTLAVLGSETRGGESAQRGKSCVHSLRMRRKKDHLCCVLDAFRRRVVVGRPETCGTARVGSDLSPRKDALN
jgi:hypothetical protein